MKLKLIEKPNNKNFIDRTGEKFHYLTVLGYSKKVGKTHYCYCKCDCGNLTEVLWGNLRTANTKSCGNCELMNFKNTKHNMYNSSEYNSYNNAKARCENLNHPRYADWGGRGIEFRFSSFEEFLQEIGTKPEPKKDYSIERIDNTKHYEKGNVKWENSYNQTRNKRDNFWITYQNKKQVLNDWAKQFKLNSGTLFDRLNKLGWCLECSLNIKPNQGVCSHKIVNQVEKSATCKK